MKQGWEKIPFEDSIVKVKYTTKIPSNDYLEQGVYPIVSQEEGLISGYWNNEENVFKISSPVVIFGDHTRILKYVDFDFVLGADGVKILQPINGINAKFFKLYLQSCKIPSLGYSRHYKLLKELQVPIPPIEEQERIVAELDCLSGVIEKKREQLNELDALAQSIFYQMFGDPITNEKGWAVKKLGEVTILYNGRAFKPTDWSENGLPIVRIQNLNNRNASYNLYNGEVSNAHRLYGGELLYAWSGTPDTSFGAHIWYGTDAVLNQHIFKVEFDDNVLNKKFFLFLLNSQVHSMFDQTHGGVGLQHITKGTLTSQNVIIPHLALQKQFAESVEKIEQQKKLISQSIKEAEDLFNSRMDYYFN